MFFYRKLEYIIPFTLSSTFTLTLFFLPVHTYHYPFKLDFVTSYRLSLVAYNMLGKSLVDFIIIINTVF